MPKQVKTELKELGIGNKVRQLRLEKGITIQELSEVTGLSKGLISQIENDQVSPPISTLLKIASALKTDIGHFFEESKDSALVTVVTKEERIKSTRRGIKGIDLGYTYESLAHKKSNKHMEPFLVTFSPKEKDEVVMFNHEGEEFVHVLKGKLEFITEETGPIVLKEGDSMYFESKIFHGYRALENEPAIALVVVYNKI